MAKEPCGLVADPKRTMHLVSRDALFGSGHKKQRGQPFREWHLRALENGFDRDRELLTALTALVKARTVGFALERGHVIASSAAMGANRALRPNPSLKPFAGFRFVSEDRILEVRHGPWPS